MRRPAWRSRLIMLAINPEPGPVVLEIMVWTVSGS